MKDIVTLILLVAFLIALPFALKMVESRVNAPGVQVMAEQQRARYCEMVRLNMEDPGIGWPDYKNSYMEDCTE